MAEKTRGVKPDDFTRPTCRKTCYTSIRGTEGRCTVQPWFCCAEGMREKPGIRSYAGPAGCQALAVCNPPLAGSTAERFCNTVQITMAPSRSKTDSAANSGLKPSVSAKAPTTRANSVLAVHAAMPVRPLAVATSLRPNTSDESVISAPDSDWCANPPTHNRAIAA